VANLYNYYGVKDDYAWHFVGPQSPITIRWWQPKLISESDVVWCEGPQGGVRLVHSNFWKGFHRARGYITQQPEEMKEFMWVKLKAVSLGK
jgi:hypothetical protein